MKRLWLDIELTNICNATCICCDRKSMEQQWLGVMKDDIYISLLDKGAPYLNVMSFWGIGDPFLDPKFWSRIELLLEKIDTCNRKKDIHVFVYSKMQNMKASDFQKIKDIQDRWYNFMFYLSIFSFKKQPYEMMTWLSHETFMKNFKLLIKSKIQYKINFTLTKYNIDELPFLIKNFNNYQIETVHDFRGQLKREDFILENMKNIDFVARPTNTPEHLIVSSFSITYTGDFRYTDQDSKRDIDIWNIQNLSFQEADSILSKIEAWNHS